MEPLATQDPMDPMAPMDPMMDMGVGAGMGMGMPEGLEPGPPMPEVEPPPAPVDPMTEALDSVLDIPGPDAVRLVYRLATAAARAKVQVRAHLDRMDARAYHAALSAAPEARYADDLTLARRELDVLAQERRRLGLEAVRAREMGRPASIYELQAEAATRGMESVALGMLLFLALPQGLPMPESDNGKEILS
jgi:hypothetical protein